MKRGVLPFETGKSTLELVCNPSHTRFMFLGFRLILALFLTCCIAATSSAAAARLGMQDAQGQLVICTGDGVVTLYLDAQGEPTAAPHSCPDCLVPSLEALGITTQAAPQPRAFRRIAHAPMPYFQALTLLIQATARAPPGAA